MYRVAIVVDEGCDDQGFAPKVPSLHLKSGQKMTLGAKPTASIKF
jgi:hypothetical protein